MSVPAWAQQDPALDELHYAVVDVETTGGTPARGHRITEVAAYRIDRRGRVLDELRTLVNPERPIPRGITRLTRITQAMVDEAPRFSEIAPTLQRVMANAVFVAHNAPFDRRWLKAELSRANYAGPSGRVLCTVQMARKLVPEIKGRSLDALIHFFGIPCEARHRAWADARATVTLLLKLFERVEAHDIWTWEPLQALLQQKAKRKKRSALPRSMDWPESA